MEQLAGAVEKAPKEHRSPPSCTLRLTNSQAMKADVGIAGTDLILTDLAALLKHSVSEDSAIIARLGDDTFAVLLTESDEKPP